MWVDHEPMDVKADDDYTAIFHTFEMRFKKCADQIHSFQSAFSNTWKIAVLSSLAYSTRL